MNKPRLSCIVLTADSQNEKAGSIRHVLAALMLQDHPSFEIIIVDNGKTSVKEFLKTDCSYYKRKNPKHIAVNVVRPKHRLSIGGARNFGASFARGMVLVFNDDDTIPVSKHALSIIAKDSRRAKYGFGAKRSWTKGDIFQKRSEYYLRCIQKQNAGVLLIITGTPKPGARGSKESFLGEYSFIGNFGFCQADLFKKVGGFADYPGYGFEDDWLMYKLYRVTKKYILLEKIKVIHVNHDVHLSLRPNLYEYIADLNDEGAYWFHSGLLFSHHISKGSALIQPLQTLHFDHRVEAAYLNYLDRRPLHLVHADHKKIRAWIKHEQLTRVEFSRTLDLLSRVSNFDRMVCRSKSDLDNLGPIVQAGLREGVLKIGNRGRVDPAFHFRFTSDVQKPEHSIIEYRVKSKLNQFPCDKKSRLRRFELIKRRFPFVEFIRLALIGDDDQVSSCFVNEHWAQVVVIEKDPQLVTIIKKSNPKAVVLKADITDSRAIQQAPRVETFITDPPYTFHGALAFIIAGLELLDLNGGEKEFFVILNPTMMGDCLDRLISILATSGATLFETQDNFSSYKLPRHYDEYRRSRVFASAINGFRAPIKYSSSSSLYIFHTSQPDIKQLRVRVNRKLLYNHFV